MTTDSDVTNGPASEEFGQVARSWGWMLALGILYLVMGVIGLYMTGALTLASVLFFGIMLLIGGIGQIIDTFSCKGWKSVVWHILIALAYLVAGAILIYDPVGGALALTFVVAAMLLASGIMRIIMAFQLRGTGSSLWLGLGGVASIVLCVMIFSGWPYTGLFAIGLFVAIELIVAGWSTIAVAFAARKAGQAASA